MKLLLLDNSSTRKANDFWQQEKSGGKITYKEILSGVPEDRQDAIIVHYNDFENGTYRPNDIYCFLLGIYSDKNGEFAGISKEKWWVDFVLNFTSADATWNQMWYETGMKCRKALFFTGGGENQFSEDFKKVIAAYEEIEPRVGYCYPASTAQTRIRKILAAGSVSTSALFDFDFRFKVAIKLLSMFIPVHIEIQMANLDKICAQTRALVEERSLSEMAKCMRIITGESLVVKAKRLARGSQSSNFSQTSQAGFDSLNRLLDKLSEIQKLFPANCEELDDIQKQNVTNRCNEIFGFISEAGERKLAFDDATGLHHTYIQLRDSLLSIVKDGG